MSLGVKTVWTEAEVQGLIGQPESIRREYKSGVMFDRGPESAWVQNLSKEVSALANSEGGELILGIDEDKKSKPRLASAMDGVSVEVAPERLQHLIEGNVSPYLPGIRVLRVKLSSRSDRVVFVIHVPQGSTAYQANDGRYYGRSEFEVKLKSRFEQSFSTLPLERNARIAERVGNALVHGVFERGATLKSRQDSIDLLLQHLGALDRAFEGELRKAAGQLLPQAVSSVRIARLNASGPCFDVDAVGSLSNPAVEAMPPIIRKSYWLITSSNPKAMMRCGFPI